MPAGLSSSKLFASIRNSSFYQRLRASRAYDAYWSIADPRHITERDAEVAFYRELLSGMRAGDTIYDIGANLGYKVDIFLRLGARVVAVDPDPFNQAMLAGKFLKFRLAKRPVTIVPKAISDENALQTMWVEQPGSAKNTLSRKWVDTLKEDEQRFGEAVDFKGKVEVETVTLGHLIKQCGAPYFIKIDVEGHEPSVLQTLDVPVPFVSFEVNLPDFEDEGLRCVDLLAAVNEGGEFNYAGQLKDGLRLEQWGSADEMRAIIRNCDLDSVEIFWRSNQPLQR